MSSMPLVSVIIPTYNRAYIVGEAIDSVLSQTYPHVEVFVVDDGSSDNTTEVLRSFGRRIQVVRQQNAGPAAARNRALEAAQGEIITFLDSDDLWLPHYLGRQISVLHRAGNLVPCSLCNAWIETPGEKRVTSFDVALMFPPWDEGIWLNVPEVVATRPVMFNQMAAIRRSSLQAVGGFNPAMHFWEDFDLEFRLSLRGPWAFIREPLVIYRRNTPGSLADEALHDRLTLAQVQIETVRRMLAAVAGQGSLALEKCLRARLRRADWQLASARLGAKNGCPSSALARPLNAVLRCVQAMYRRSPGFPTMMARAFTS